MLIKINYGAGVGAFPISCAEQVKRASLCDLKVLWIICSKGGAVEMDELCEFASATESEVISSLSYWRGAGVIDADIMGTVASAAIKKPEKKPERKIAVPQEYTPVELANLLEEKPEYSPFISECQKILGKMFNPRDTGVIVRIVNDLRVDFEYILMLLKYCASIDKKTLNDIRKTAHRFYDDGITTPEELDAELRRRELAASVEGSVRSMFGIGARAFTTKEKAMISAWVNDWEFSVELIRKAYEITANTTGNASIPYANSVLERWNAEGLRTPEQIDAANIKYNEEIAQKKQGKKRSAPTQTQSENSSFNIDEFFEAAVRRSLGGDGK